MLALGLRRTCSNPSDLLHWASHVRRQRTPNPPHQLGDTKRCYSTAAYWWDTPLGCRPIRRQTARSCLDLYRRVVTARWAERGWQRRRASSGSERRLGTERSHPTCRQPLMREPEMTGMPDATTTVLTQAWPRQGSPTTRSRSRGCALSLLRSTRSHQHYLPACGSATCPAASGVPHTWPPRSTDACRERDGGHVTPPAPPGPSYQ
jgi:hypothetical protein